jgi:hypothetical protein
MKFLTKEDLQRKTERTFTEVTLPPPDPNACKDPVKVRIRSMYWEEYRSLLASMTNAKGERDEWRNEHFGELKLARCWVDESGKRILEDADLNSDWWKRKHPAFVKAFISAVSDHNEDTAEHQEAALKNCEEIGNCACSIALPTDAVTTPLAISSTL